MKPIKNRIFCPDIQRTKMLFESKEKADNFMKFNNKSICEDTGFCPQRSYYCDSCGGWHITHYSNYESIKKESIKKDLVVKKYNTDNLEDQISGFTPTQKITFLTNKIKALNIQIEKFISNNDKEELKLARKTLQAICILRKKHGFKKESKFKKIQDIKLSTWGDWYEGLHKAGIVS
jgi:hypothetical protein